MDEGDILLRDVASHPDFGEVCDDEQLLRRLDDLAAREVAADDASGERRDDRNMGPNLPCLIQASEFLLGHAEEREMVACFVGFGLHAEQLGMAPLRLRLADDLLPQQERRTRIRMFGHVEFGAGLQIGGLCQAQVAAVENGQQCVGFDLLAQVRGLFAADLRSAVERLAGPLWDRPPQTEVPIGRALELVGMQPRLHIPGLGALSQGPGFANLGSLGLLANRVLQPYLPGLGAGAEPARPQRKSVLIE